jgi:hypothetical protein
MTGATESARADEEEVLSVWWNLHLDEAFALKL